MTRKELAQVVAFALRHGYLDVSLTIDQAVSQLARRTEQRILQGAGRQAI